MLNDKEREEADCLFVINYQSTSGWGMCLVNKIDQGERVVVVVVPNEEFYHFRGPDPNYMTRWEYYNGIRIVKQPQKDTDNKDGHRKENGVSLLEEGDGALILNNGN